MSRGRARAGQQPGELVFAGIGAAVNDQGDVAGQQMFGKTDITGQAFLFEQGIGEEHFVTVASAYLAAHPLKQDGQTGHACTLHSYQIAML
jgi:hypothetical protein